NTYDYDAHGWVVGHKGPTGACTRVVRNREGHIVEATTPVGGVYSWKRDAHGQVIQEINPCGAVTTLAYDAGRVCAVTLPEGQTMQLAWNARGQLRTLRAPDGASHQWSYNNRGEVVELQDPAGRTRTLGLDAHGRTIVVRDFDGTTYHYTRAGDGKVLHYRSPWVNKTVTYHPGGEPIALEQAGHRTLFDYDFEGRLICVVAPRGGDSSHSSSSSQPSPSSQPSQPSPSSQPSQPSPPSHRFERDRLGAIVCEYPPRGEPRQFRRNLRGEVVQIDFALGKSLHIERDAAGRLTAVRSENDNSQDHGSNVHSDNAETYRYDAAGQLVEAVNQHQRVSLTRDRVGRIVREQAGAHWLRVERCSQASPLLLQSSLGLTQRYAYTTRGRVVSNAFELPNQGSTLWALH
ncbi:MAG: hypothetical protein ACPG4T_23990, partial [Nannocystaceae bacterium]